MQPIWAPHPGTNQDRLEAVPAVETNHPPCPVCTGGMVPLRSFYRCSRCGFCLCIGCGGGPGLTDNAAD